MTPRTTSLGALTRERLCALAGPRSYERGKGYARARLVGDIAEDRGRLAAVVQGTESYRTHLEVAGARITWGCSCPLGADGTCCKHVVALGLTQNRRGMPR